MHRLINDIVIPNIQHDRVIVAINQADMAMSGRHWNSSANAPDRTLRKFLGEKSLSVRQRIEEATGVRIPVPVCYSAERDYNMTALIDLITSAIPDSRRELMGHSSS